MMNTPLSILFLLLLAVLCYSHHRRRDEEAMRLLKEQIEGDFRVMKGKEIAVILLRKNTDISDEDLFSNLSTQDLTLLADILKANGEDDD